MRKLKLQMQMSIDGFVSTGPNDEQQWVTWAWDEIKGYAVDMINTSDTIVIGRKLAVDFIPHWDKTAKDSTDVMIDLARGIARAKKVIFSKTLPQTDLPNTIIAKKDLATTINELKSQEGKDLYVCGGSSFVAGLIQANLIDEFHLFINPVALGKGDPIFNLIPQYRSLVLKNSITYPSGLVLVHYGLK